MAKLKLKAFQPYEMDEQIVVIKWAKLRERHCPALTFLFASLNGVKLPIGLAVKMKRAGMKAGCPDLCLPIPTTDPGTGGHWCGLWVELKRRHGGVVSNEQETWIAELLRLGYMVKVCNGATEAIACIAKYLGIPI